MRLLGLDFGTKRIGIAISDELLLTAQIFDTIHRKTPAEDIDHIFKIVKENNITEIVVGLPINMDGSYGAKAKEVIKFMDSLAEAVNIPIKTWDERLTTIQVERTLIEADMSRAKRRKVVDRLAAQLILQSYLDSRRRE